MPTNNNLDKIHLEHPRYFAGQYLLEDDFQLQHDYLSDRLEYHNQGLHVSGIIEGLEVIEVNGKIKVSPGSAIHTNGKLLVLKESPDPLDKTLGDIYLECEEEKATEPQAGSTQQDSCTRYQEVVTVKIGSTENAVILASIEDEKGEKKLKQNKRQYSGIALPSSQENRLTLRGQQGGGAVLNGNLKVSGAIDFENRTAQLINLWVWEQHNYGIGIQHGTQYFRTAGNFAWYQGGVHKNTLGEEGGGTVQMVIRDTGNVGIGTNNPTQKLEVNGNLKVTGTSAFDGDLSVTGAINFQRNTGSKINLCSEKYAIGIQNDTQYFRTDRHFAWYQGGVHTNGSQDLDASREAGEGGKVLMTIGSSEKNPTPRLEVNGNLNVSDTIYRGGNPLIYENYEIYLRGSANGSSEGNNTFLKIANVSIAMTNGRGLNTVILNPNGSYKNQTFHDVYPMDSGPAAWNAWADWINKPGNVADGDVVAVASWDAIRSAPKGGSAETLLTSIHALRAFENAGSEDPYNHIPYVLLFIKGRAGAMEVRQPYQGPNAHLKTTYYELFNYGNTDNLSVTGAINFGKRTGQMINLWDENFGSGINFGIGIQHGTQYFRTAGNFAWYRGGVHKDTLGEEGGGAVQMVIRNTGNVGIGTNSPTEKLEVNGNLKVTGTSAFGGNLTIGTEETKVQLDVHGNLTVNSSTKTYKEWIAGNFGSKDKDRVVLGYVNGAATIGAHNKDLDAWANLCINPDPLHGNVGIGTNNPTKGKLQIEGSQGSYIGTYYWFAPSKQIGCQEIIKGTYDENSKCPYSLYASQRIAAIEFNAFSDARIKEIGDRSDSQTDLKTLLQIEVTDYSYRDKIANGNRQHKKVIGQQVAKVFPQAVSTHTDIVCDILQFAPIAEGWVTLKDHGLKTGERVKLMWGENNSQIFTIEAVTPDSFQVSLDYSGNILVYGREVDDFHVVDYDALSMLHISATQALYQVITKLQEEVENLKQKQLSFNMS